MVQKAFEALFVATLVAPPLAVLVGVALLAFMPRRRDRHEHAARPVHA